MEGFNLDEYESLLNKLKTLPAKVEKNIMTSAVRAAATMGVKAIKSKAPSGKTGNLKKGIKVRAKRSEKGTVHMNISSTNYYARFLEFGYNIYKPKRKKGKNRTITQHILPKRFFEPAYREIKPRLIEAFVKKIQERLAKLAASK